MGQWDAKRERSHHIVSWVVAQKVRPGQPCSRQSRRHGRVQCVVAGQRTPDPCSVQGAVTGPECPHMDTAGSWFCFRPATAAQACSLASWNLGNRMVPVCGDRKRIQRVDVKPQHSPGAHSLRVTAPTGVCTQRPGPAPPPTSTAGHTRGPPSLTPQLGCSLTQPRVPVHQPPPGSPTTRQ